MLQRFLQLALISLLSACCPCFSLYDSEGPFPPPLAHLPRSLGLEPAAAPGETRGEPQAATASPGCAGPAGPTGGPGGEDIETLAMRLYPRISRQLRLELTHERDRLGALTDFRH